MLYRNGLTRGSPNEEFQRIDEGVAGFIDIGLVSNAYAATVSLVPTSNVDEVTIGDQVTFDIVIDFTGDPTLGGGFDIAYDTNDLVFVGFVLNPDTGVIDPDFSRSPDLLPNLLASGAVGRLFGVPDVATLGSVTFQVLAGIGPNTTVAITPTSGIGGPWISATDFLTILNPTYNQVLVSFDTDGDGTPNATDLDDDNDGVNDGDEINAGTDPLDPDSDDDGVNDGDEINAGTDPLDPDSDDDGIGDALDDDPLVANNFIPCVGAEAYTFTEMVVGPLTCAATASITVVPLAEVLGTGNLHLIAPIVIIDPDTGIFSVAGSLKVTSANPCPSCPPPPPPPTVFVTSQTYDGDLNGLSGGDAKCQARADAAGFGGTWTAWLSTFEGASSAVVRLSNAGALGPFRRTDGVIVAQDLNDLIDSTLAAPINLDENGLTRSSQVWTGTSATGTATGMDCDNWNSASSAVGRLGDTTQTDGAWTASANQSCTTLYSLYCFANPGAL